MHECCHSSCSSVFFPLSKDDIFCPQHVPDNFTPDISSALGLVIRFEVRVAVSSFQRTSFNYKKVAARDEFICRYCGDSPRTTFAIKMHVDHIDPWSSGGGNSTKNLTFSCGPCNLYAHNLVFPSFRSKREFILQRKTTHPFLSEAERLLRKLGSPDGK